jgi:NADH-quinone oxidoreductase subunit F
MAEGKGRPADLDLILNLAVGMKGRTLCPMGDAAALPVHAIVSKFRGELEKAVPR